MQAAVHIRPMRIALLNLMPEKIKTETQIARVLGGTPLQVEIVLLKLGRNGAIAVERFRM